MQGFSSKEVLTTGKEKSQHCAKIISVPFPLFFVKTRVS